LGNATTDVSRHITAFVVTTENADAMEQNGKIWIFVRRMADWGKWLPFGTATREQDPILWRASGIPLGGDPINADGGIWRVQAFWLDNVFSTTLAKAIANKEWEKGQDELPTGHLDLAASDVRRVC
jgi:hypothetical protein